MKPKLILLALLALVGLTGCETVSVSKRTMKITTPLFSYESETEGLAAATKPVERSN